MFVPMQLQVVDQEQIAEADSLLRADIAQEVRTFAGMTWEERFQVLMNDVWTFAWKLAVVVAIFVVGRWIIRRIVKLLTLIFERRHVDQSLHTFTRSMVEITLYIVLFYLMIAWLGVNTSLFVALFAAAGLSIGMAMSGVFQNFAGGVMILMLKPFRVGDWIEVQSQAGTVMDIRLFNTVLRTADNKTILLPNGSVSTGVVNNYNVAKTRRLEWTVSLVPGVDFVAVHNLLIDLMKADPRVLTTPVPEVLLSKINTGSLDVVAHAWVASADNQDVYYDMNAVIYKSLPERGFDFAVQQPVSVTVQQSAVQQQPK